MLAARVRPALSDKRPLDRLSTGSERAGYTNNGFLFCKPGGTPYDPDRREFVRKQEKYNRDAGGSPLTRLTLHGLRHIWATLALHEGIYIKIVSGRLNHSSTFITREIYTQVTPPMQCDAAERVATRLFEDDERPTG